MKNYYALTVEQQNIWNTEMFYSNSSVNNVGGYIFIDEKVDFNLLQKTANLYVEHSDNMRLHFINDGNIVKQYVSDYTPFNIDIKELMKKDEIDEYSKELASKQFQINDNDLYKFYIFRLPDGRGGLIGIFHHLICDAYSIGILISRIMEIYSSIKKSFENVENIKDFPSYISHIIDSKNYIKSDNFKKDKIFWDEVYSSKPNITYIYNKPNISDDINGNRVQCKIDSALNKKIVDFCSKNHVSEYTFFTALYAIFLTKLNDTNSCIIGTPVLNRANYKEKQISGMFVSTVPFKIDVDLNLSFSTFIRDVYKKQISLFRHQKYPYSILLQNLKEKYDFNQNLYDFVFSYQNARDNKNTCDINYKSNWIINNTIVNSLEAHFYDMDDEKDPYIYYNYQTAKYTKHDIENINNIIMQMAKYALNDATLKDIKIISDYDSRVINECNSFNYKYDKNESVVSIFEKKVNENRDKVVEIFNGKKITYDNLDKKTNKICNFLLEQGVKKNEVIAVIAKRGFELLYSMWGIVKSGGCYLLIDPTLPNDRIKYMIENSDCTKIIAQKDFVNKVADMNLNIYDFEDMKKCSDKFTNVPVSNSDRFSLIYTSGSTGKPKGIAIKRLGAINLANVYKHQFDIDKCDRFLCASTVAFDIFFVENVVSVLNGKTIVLADENEQNIPVFMSKLINENKPDFVLITPSKLSLLLNESSECLQNFKIIQIGGEALTEKLFKKLRPVTNADIYDIYGPSECTVACSAKKIIDNSQINIGHSLLNYNVTIRNSNNDFMPVGFPGEIVVEGDGVGIGYLKKYDFNGIYRTGDLGYINENSDIVYMGRKDSQIKLHGLRIELDEIKNQLLNYNGIKNAVAVVKKVNNIDTLCAYVECNSSIFDENDVKETLAKTLPYYMIPAHIVLLDKLPITINGKVDLKHLPEINSESQNFIELSTQTEKNIADMWYKILDLNKNTVKLGKNSNFFELGGDSLCSIRLVSEIYSKFSISIDIKDIFDNPSIVNLANFIDNKISTNSLNNNNIKITEKHELRNYYPLSSAQKRIYFANLIDKNSNFYNTPFGIEFDKQPDIERLKNAFNKIVNLHESFRTYLVLTDSDVSQAVLDHVDFDLKINYFKNDNFVQSFDLFKAPLMRAELDLYDNKALLQIDIHHIICDGTSIQTFAKELCYYYNHPQEQESKHDSSKGDSLKLDYIDFALNEKINDDDKKYWINQFSNDIPMLNIPTVYERTSELSHKGHSIYSELSNGSAIESFCKKNGVTPYMFLLTCFYIELYKYTMQNDIVIGSPSAGRTNSQFSDTIGMFVNTLALRQKITSSDTFAELLNSVKNNCINAFYHQNYPFDELVKNLNLKHEASRNPLFDVMFSYESAGFPDLKLDGLKTKYVFPENNTSKFDISMEITPILDIFKNTNYQIRLEYMSTLYNEIFINDFIRGYKNIIDFVLANPDSKISKIQMMDNEMISKVEMFPKLNLPKNKVIIDLFNEQVESNPNNIALVFENKQYTYKELDELSNRLANYIINLPIYKERILKNKYRVIAILLNRKAELIISILAVLKAGCGYIPIDPTYPSERINYILDDSNAKLIITQSDIEINNIVITNNDLDKKQYILVDDFSKYKKSSKVENISKPDDVSYMIYTSGSTGKPKGVILTQKGVVNFIYGMCNRIDFKGRTIVNITTASFDIFVLESLLPLCTGMKIVLAGNEEQNNPLLLNKLCLKNKVEIIQTTPSKFKFLMSDDENIQYIKNMKIISLAGEPFTKDLFDDIKKINSSAKIYNMYGPTETTVGSTLLEIRPSMRKITIGTPISNTFTTILDKDLNTVPLYVPGNLYIGGDGVAVGYMNKKDLTDEKFINYKGIRVFNSADLAKVVPVSDNDNSNSFEIDCLGRADFQVKVHGLRIELGEIENDIRSYKNIIDSVVTVKKINGNDILCGYFTAEGKISVSLLKQQLIQKLPRYMVPGYLVQLDSFKHTPNGKIDRKQLPDPEFIAHKILPPTNALEQEILYIWKSILSIDVISTDDNFFDIGGDSLFALKLQLELMKLGYNINYGDIFKYSTIKDLSNFIENNKSEVIHDNFNKSTFYNPYSSRDFRAINKVLSKNNIKRKLNIRQRQLENVLLIGSTGFLGIHILQELLKFDDIKIYCLIRPDISTSPENKLKNKFKYYFGSDLSNLFGKRIFVIEGDISSDLLNLSYDEYSNLGHCVKYVINCAALVKHFGDYESFKKINVDGVKNLVDFCESYGLEFVQTSTLSVSGNIIVDNVKNYKKQKLKSFAENNLYIKQSLDNVYVRSKFEAEKFILNELSKKRLRGIILRIGNITNRYSDGKFQENKEENAFANKLKAFISLGMVPKSIMNGYAEFSPVDIVAKAIITSLIYHENNISVLHLYNPNHLYFKDLLNILLDVGVKISVVDNEVFNNKLIKWLNSNSNFSKVSILLNDLDDNRNLVYKTNIKIKNDFSLKYFKSTDFIWPTIDKTYIAKLIKNL